MEFLGYTNKELAEELRENVKNEAYHLNGWKPKNEAIYDIIENSKIVFSHFYEQRNSLEDLSVDGIDIKTISILEMLLRVDLTDKRNNILKEMQDEKNETDDDFNYQHNISHNFDEDEDDVEEDNSRNYGSLRF